MTKSTSNDWKRLLDTLATNPLQNYVLHELETSLRQVRQLEDSGIELSTEDVGNLSRFFFDSGHGNYIGIESNLPSTYYDVYPDYLKDHENYLKRLAPKDRQQTKRILIAQSGSDIRTDALLHPKLYKDFIEWHEQNGVGLYWIEANKAEKIQASLQLGTTDIALWDSAQAVTFKPHLAKHMVDIQLFRKNVDTFNAILQYARSILAEATLLTIDLDSLPVMSEELVQRWEGYAGSREFRENGIGKLLLHELNSKQGWIAGRVLDAAAGSGYEARYLASNSYDVTANELDPTWNHILTARLASESLPVEIYQYDWLGMSQHLKPLYTAVLAVGNSLSMAIGKSQRQRVVEEFYKVLKPGGKLIIDERNFPLVEQYLKRGEPYSAKSVLYDCSSVAGELTFEDRANNLIRFTLKDTESERTLGAIVVQSLPKNELLQLLKKAGFHDIITYSDLRPGKDPTAHIYTYIATK